MPPSSHGPAFAVSAAASAGAIGFSTLLAALVLGNPASGAFVSLAQATLMDSAPRETWEPLFRSQGTKNPTPRIRMMDGFNEGWIEFENGESGSRKGEVVLKAVLKMLLKYEGK